MLNAPPRGLTRNFHINTNAPPDMIPASAPASVVLFQNNEQRITAPKAPPNPAHAKDTIWNTLELGSLARKTLIIEITTTVILATRMLCFSEIFTPKKSFKRFSENPEEAANSWLSAVDIVAARIPARITPAKRAVSKPCWLNILAMAIITVSLSARDTIAPDFDIASPITPMKIATAIANTTQMEAILLERVSLFCKRI